MESRISMLFFLGVLLTGHSFAQVQTDCTTNGTSSNGNINATTNCTSTDTGAAQAERNRENAEGSQAMGNALGTGLAAVIVRHKEKKELKKYCDQHPGEKWVWKQADGSVTSSGICPGQMRFDVARQLYARSLQAELAKAGVAGYAKFDGDVLTVHSERASMMRFHANTSDEKFLPWFRTMNVKTYIYTNDADQRFEFDVVHNREVTTDTTAVADTPQSVTQQKQGQQAIEKQIHPQTVKDIQSVTPTTATPAAMVTPAAPPN